MILTKFSLYDSYLSLKRRVESNFNLFANVEIVHRDSCDIGSLPEDVAIVVYCPKIKAWYESNPDSKGRTSKCFKEFYKLNAPESVEDKYHKYFKSSQDLEFQRIVFLRPYNYEKQKTFTKLYASSSDLGKTKDGYYFDFCLSEIGEVIERPAKLLIPPIKKRVFAFKSNDFENCLLSNKVEW